VRQRLWGESAYVSAVTRFSSVLIFSINQHGEKRMKNRIPYLLATGLFSLVFLLVSPLMGQSPTGALRGTVIDPSGAKIADARIVMADNATGTQYTTQTGATGEFSIGNLNPASYTVTVIQGAVPNWGLQRRQNYCQ
jgi:Carboxypeptidase regulatory-like domain